MSRKAANLKGQRFGMLVPMERAGLIHGDAAWICACDCGNTKVTTAYLLKSGDVTSCGCKTSHHGHSDERLYNVWKSMRKRCCYQGSASYKYYGARGIKVCKEWNDYETFRTWALSHGYDKDAAFGQCTIDRIDPNGDYQPDNCRWVSMKVQAHNRR